MKSIFQALNQQIKEWLGWTKKTIAADVEPIEAFSPSALVEPETIKATPPALNLSTPETVVDFDVLDISVVITTHHEGLLVHRTLQSVYAGIAVLKQQKLTAEIVIVADRIDTLTRNYLERNCSDQICDIRIIETDNGDVGLSRNQGVQGALGKYVAILDGDDLISSQWLLKAWTMAKNSSTKTVCIPEYFFDFERENFIGRQISSDHPAFSNIRLLERNYWASFLFMPKSIFATHQYQPSQAKLRLGYEDWHFHCELIADGFTFRVVPRTCVFYRKKLEDSRLAENNNSRSVIDYTKLFDIQRFCRYPYPLATVYDPKHTFPGAEKEPPLDSHGPEIDFRVHPYLPFEVCLQWREIYEIEPLLFPNCWLPITYDTMQFPVFPISNAYYTISQKLAGCPKVDYIFLVPWMIRGGADLTVLNYLNALQALRPKASILLIYTENKESPWLNRVPKGIHSLEFGKITESLEDAEKLTLLLRLVIQMQPSVIHNINSEIAYKLFITYHALLATKAKLFITSFCFERGDTFEILGYSRLHAYYYDSLSGIFADNQHHLNEMTTIYGLSPDRLFVHYQPMNMTQNQLPEKSPKEFTEQTPLKVLWAGRFDKQKRVELMIEIAERTQGLPIEYHVYGIPSINPTADWERLHTMANTRYHGSYENFFDLDLEDMDLFLYTSSYDGLPNVLLESISRGLPIIAPNIGGVCELLTHQVTGLIVQEKSNIEEYLANIHDVLEGRVDLLKIREQALKALREQHAPERFHQRLEATPGYLVGSTTPLTKSERLQTLQPARLS